MSDDVDRERFEDLVNFQRSTINMCYEDREKQAKVFLHDNGDIVAACFDSETFFPRRPTATDFKGFSAKFYSEQARQSAAVKKPRIPIPPGSTIIDVDNLPDNLRTPGVAERF